MTDLDDLKQRVSEIEPDLKEHPFVELAAYKRNWRTLHLCLTERLHQICRKAKIWKSKPFLTALKNAQYGFDESYARSSGGRDGIFLVDRTYYPPNEMQIKLFDRYLEHPDSGAETIAAVLNTSIDALQAVRLVSHHMRLLGVLWQAESEDWLVLVDFDATKETTSRFDDESDS